MADPVLKIQTNFNHTDFKPSVYELSYSFCKSCFKTKNIFIGIVIFVFSALVLLSFPVFAKEEGKTNFFTQDTLFGDWGGKRRDLSDHGIDFEFTYTADMMKNTVGGATKQSEYLDSIDLVMAIDAEKLLGWKGASFNFYGAGFQGGSPSANSGDLQGPSNIEADDAWKLLEAWYQQILFDEKLSFLLGLYDVNSEFDSIETAAFFLNSSQGMGIDFSQTGLNGPSAWPNTALALRLRIEPQKWFYVQTAILDGVAGDPNHPHSTRIRWDESEGVLITSELGFLPGEIKEDAAAGKVALGGWIYSSHFDDLSDLDSLGNPVRRSGNFGVYGIVEHTVFREASDHEQGLSAYARFGYANPQMNQINYYTGAGFVYTGLIPKRDDDALGFSVANAINGNHFLEAQNTLGTPMERMESNFELSYCSKLTPWFSLQPDVQYIVNPGTDPALSNAMQIGLRLGVIF